MYWQFSCRGQYRDVGDKEDVIGTCRTRSGNSGLIFENHVPEQHFSKAGSFKAGIYRISQGESLATTKEILIH